MGFSTWRSLLCIGTLAIALETAHAGDAPVVHLETYGDSLTSGFLSDRTIATPPGLSTISQLMSELLTIELNGDKHKFEKYEAREVAWPAVLRGWLAAAEKPTSLTNAAVTGAFVWELGEQIERAGVSSEPTAAFFWVGHNDLCHQREEPEKYADYMAGWYRDALERWDRNHTNSVAYVLPLGDVNRVYKTLDGFVWYENNGSKFKCDDSWLRLFPYCRPNSRLFKQGKFDEFFIPRQQAMGRAITKLAAELTAKSRSNRFVFLDGVLSDEMKTSFFSIDCYHLSKLGQAGVATQVFRRVGQEIFALAKKK